MFQKRQNIKVSLRLPNGSKVFKNIKVTLVQKYSKY